MRSTCLLRNPLLLLLASSVALGACNAITGADNLEIGGGGQGGSGAGATTNPLAEATGVGMSQIALYQGVKAVLMQDGQATSNDVPIVAGRDALMRVFVSVDGDYDGKPVTGRLTIDGAADPIEVTQVANGSPLDNDLGSTLNFRIPGAGIRPGFSFKVILLQPVEDSKGSNPNSRYPADGFAATNAKSVGQSVKITLVPIKYGADGSNRLPDTSPAMVQGYQDLFYGMYPAPSIEMTVRDPVQYDNEVSPNGFGWDELLAYVQQVRAEDKAPFDAYYFGIFSPAASLNQFCGGGCVVGLGNIAGPGDAYARAAIGVGFGDDGGVVAWETAVHELGHAFGRYHSPCGGAGGTDPDYPYPNAAIGVWGYNLLTQKLYDPNGTTDVMGYCEPIWVSDFTWKGLYQRIESVNGAKIVSPPEVMNLTYDRARMDAEGNLHWLPAVSLAFPPLSEPVDLLVDTDTGTYAVTGHFYPYDHLTGGIVLWPQAAAPSSSVSFEWKGQIKSLWK
jgi:hypothetical protein